MKYLLFAGILLCGIACDESEPEPASAEPFFSCEIVEQPRSFCDEDDCPIAHQGELACGGADEMSAIISHEPGNAPVIIVDTLEPRFAPIFVDTGADRAEPLVGIPIRAAMTTHGPETFVAFADPFEPLWALRRLDGDTHAIVDDDNTTVHWSSHGVRVRDDRVTALGRRGIVAGHSVVARGTETGPWAIENIAENTFGDAHLELAADGGAIVVYTKDEDLSTWVRVERGEPELLTPANEQPNTFGVSIVPGETSWDAVLLQTRSQLVIARPGRDLVALADSTFSATSDCLGRSGRCGETCDDESRSIMSGASIVRASSGYVIAYVERRFDVHGDFSGEESCATEPCTCDFVASFDASDSDLVVVHFDETSEEITELRRFPLGTGGAIVDMAGHATGTSLAFATVSEGTVRFGVLDATAIVP